MAGSKRVLFSFDPRNYQSLQNLAADGGFSSTAEAVRGAVLVARALQSQAQQGFTEVVVRHPQTREERVLVLPTLGGGEVGEADQVEVNRKP